MRIIESALGRWDSQEDPSMADVVVGHSFGTVIGEGSVNRALADAIIENAEDRPIVVDRNLANAFPARTIKPTHVVEGPPSSVTGKGLGSWGTLIETRDFMRGEGLSMALMFAQKFHVGRVTMQAHKLGIDTIIPPDLPNGFDKNSGQIWTRSHGMWIIREVVGSMALRMRGEL